MPKGGETTQPPWSALTEVKARRRKEAVRDLKSISITSG